MDLTSKQALKILAFWFTHYAKTTKHVFVTNHKDERISITLGGLCYSIARLHCMGLISANVLDEIYSLIDAYIAAKDLPRGCFIYPPTHEFAQQRADLALALTKQCK